MMLIHGQLILFITMRLLSISVTRILKLINMTSFLREFKCEIEKNMSKKRAASPDSDNGESDSDSGEFTSLDDHEAEILVLKDLVDDANMNELADEMSKCNEIVQVLEDLLQSLGNNPIGKSADQKSLRHRQHLDRALNHFNKVENVWRNMSFIGVLLKEPLLPCSMNIYSLIADRRLSLFLLREIRMDPSFKSIFKYKGTASMMRNALSILIGYWSNEDTIAFIVFALGRRSLGLKCDSKDAPLIVGDKTLASGEEKIENKISTEFSTHFEDMPAFPLVADLLQDESIKKLAKKLLHIKPAVEVCQRFLKSLKNEVSVRNDLEEHRVAANRFWLNPRILKALIKALKQSTSLLDAFKKYSRGAQLMRCVERMTRIQKDPLLRRIVESNDQDKRVSGALGILYGYWSDLDVIRMLRTFDVVQKKTHILDGVDLAKCVIQVFEYLAIGPDDVEGLENALADKYIKHSKDYCDLFNKISKSQMCEKQNATEKSSKYWYMITVMLRDGEVVYFDMHRFPRKHH